MPNFVEDHRLRTLYLVADSTLRSVQSLMQEEKADAQGISELEIIARALEREYQSPGWRITMPASSSIVNVAESSPAAIPDL